MKTEICADLGSKLSNEKEGVKDNSLFFNPVNFANFIGQKSITEKLNLYVNAAKSRQENLDHLLLFGPSGLGKTTLAKVVANELEANLKVTSAPALDKVGDIIAILTSLEEKEVLFIDEIHRLPKLLEETLYSAMENFSLDIIIGQGVGAKSVQISINKFTLIGATTKRAMLSQPLQTRFGIIERLEYYSASDLGKIILKNSETLKLKIDELAALEIGKRSRGTPRIAKRILKRVRDFCQVRNKKNIDLPLANEALAFLNIDENGLDALDQKVIIHIVNDFNGGPVGLETIAAISGEDKETIEENCEPFLIRSKILQKSARGRKIPDNTLIKVQGGKILIEFKKQESIF